jgi:hypothetical protein
MASARIDWASVSIGSPTILCVSALLMSNVSVVKTWFFLGAPWFAIDRAAFPVMKFIPAFLRVPLCPLWLRVFSPRLRGENWFSGLYFP